MSNVLIIDTEGIGLDFALRCQSHGHQTKSFIPKTHGERNKAGDGLIEKVTDWERFMRWADVIVPTGNALLMDTLEKYRDLRYPIFGPSKQSAELEVNRSYGMQVLKKHGIDVPPYKMFKSLDEAEAYCWKHDGRYVFKVLGSDDNKALTYCGKDSADMINKISRWKKQGMTLKGACMLQDFIPGVEFATSRWVGRNGFLSPIGEGFEHKKLMSSNYGQNTGEMGTVLYYTKKSKLCDQVLKPIEDFLVSIGHIGDIDVNCIIDEKGKAWPLEFTCRLGWPAFFIMCSQHEEPVEWMVNAVHGKDTLKVVPEVATGLVVALPPFPNKRGIKDEYTDMPILGITEDNWDNLHLAECKIGKGVETVDGKPVQKDMIVTSGYYAMCVTGLGSTVRKSSKQAYKNVEQIYIPDQMVRDDIGEQVEKQLPILKEHGFATTLEY